MKKIIYSISSQAHKRVFQSFVNRNDLDQHIIAPYPEIVDNFAVENYNEMGINQIHKYANTNEIQSIVDKISPDVFVQPDLSQAQNKIKLPSACKRVYVSHGMVGRHVIDLMKTSGWNISVWKGCDLYCGATKIFDKWIKYAAGKNSKTCTNAIPQFDLLHKHSNNDLKTKLNTQSYSAVIFFGGFCCKDRADFWDHNEDYFKTCCELEILAKKNNWLVLIKPRQLFSQVNKFLLANQKNWGGWTKKYINSYSQLQNSKFIHFINTSCGIEEYYKISNSMIINGCSTIEVESYILNKPLIIVNTKTNAIGRNSFSDDADNTAYRVSNIGELNDTIMHTIKNPTEKAYNQAALISSYGLTVDGKMHERVLNAVLNII